jgi:hypothetical protein
MTKLLVAASLLVATTAFAQGAAPAKPAPAPAPAPAAKPADPKGAPAAPAPAPAPAAAPEGPPPPAPELATNLKDMSGKWKCDGKTPDSAFTKAHPMKAEMNLKSDLGGYWYALRYEEKKTKENPKPYVMTGLAGWDPSKKMLVRTDADNMGQVTHLSSKGWEGDKLVWTGEVMGGAKVQFRDTLTKKSAKEISSLMEMAGPDGKFVTIGEMTCKK